MKTRRRLTDRERVQSWIATAALAVAGAIALMILVLRLAHTQAAKSQLGDTVFAVGRASVFAPKIDKDGPLLFPDLRDRSTKLNVYVQHIGTGPYRGWLAFDAHTSDVGCLVSLDRRTHQLRDCHGVVYPPDGTGLTHYEVTVDHAGKVTVDLSRPR